MLFLFSVIFLIALFGFNGSLSLPIYDPTQSIEWLFTSNSATPQSYVLLMTAQSTASGNFFVFDSATPTFSNFINIVDLTPTTRTINLTLQNTQTNQEATDLNLDISSCLQQVTYDCTADPTPQAICSIVAPPPATEGIQKITFQDIDCVSGDSNSICSSTLWQNTLTDVNLINIFATSDVLCPESSIEFQIKVEILRAYIPSSTLVGAGDISFHYRNLIPASQDSFTVSGSTIRIDQASQVTSDIDLESFSDSSYTSRSDLNTIIQTQIVRHNYTASDVYCKYQINYTGLVRGVYANDYPGPVHMPRDFDMDAESSIQASTRLALRANQPNIINIFGNRLTDTSIQFNTCFLQWRTTVTIPVSFETYLLGEVVAPSEDYTVQQTAYSCPSQCLRCTANSLCIVPTNFLAFGGNQDSCPQEYAIPDYKNVCNSVLESIAFLTSLPVVTSTQVTLNFYNDLNSSFPMGLVLRTTNKAYFTTSPFSWPLGARLLPESIPVLLDPSNYGYQQEIIPFTSTGDSSQIASANLIGDNSVTSISYITNGLAPVLNQINALYYILEDSPPGFVITYWELNGAVPTTLIDKQNPESIFTCQNNQYQHLIGTNYYIAQAFLDCVTACQLQIRSDGHIMMYKNEQTLLVDLDFKSIWTYTYPEGFTGFIELTLIITDASYFQPFVTGSDYRFFMPSNPIAAHSISPIPVDQHSCNIANCLNCQDLICYSCQEGYLLSTDQTTCSVSCASGFASPIEGVCFASSCLNNQATVTAEDLCLPSCDQPGEIFIPGEGCQLCVPECQVCSGANTCAQCKFSDPSNTDSFCARKGGSLYATTPADFNVSQTVTVLQKVVKEVALIVTDQASFSNFSFYFASKQRKIPRIIKSIKMDTTDSTMSTATLPPLTISQSGNITLHYLDIEEDLGGLNFSINGFINRVYRDWPRQDEVALIDSVTGAFVYNQMVNDFQGLSQIDRSYYTILLSKLYSHDQTQELTCKLQILYYGEVRGVYVNGQLILSDSTSGYNYVTRNSRFFSVQPDELVMVHFVGCRLQIRNIAFTSCTINSGVTSVTPVFKSYIITGSDTTSDTFYIVNNTYCGANCLTCRDSDTCIICERNYYLDDQGTCQSKCSDPSAIQYVSGYCQTPDRTQGYLMYNDFTTSTKIKTGSFLVYLNIDVQILAVMHPYTLSASNHAAYAFVSNNNPTLAQGAYQLWNYTKTQTYINLTMNLDSQVTGTGNPLDVMLFTIRNDQALLYHYSSLPSTLAQLKLADGFDYLPFAQNNIALQNNYFYYYDFFMNCTDVCYITFQAYGNVEITTNERTFVFSSFMEAAVGPVTLTRNFTGFHHLVFKVYNSSQFQYDISGPYSVFAQGDQVIHQSLATIPQQLCSKTNCLNCYKNTCFSCNPGYFLDTDTASCVAQCPAGKQGYIAERLCGPITCGPTTINSQYILRDDYCIWNCTDFPGFYYKLSEGCTLPCDDTCQTCVGPDANQCLSCDSSRILQSDNTCACAPGYALNSTGDCQALPTVVIKVNSFSSLCSNIIFEATIPASQDLSLDANSISFNWNLESSTNPNTAAQNSIKNILNSQNSNIITISKQLLFSNPFSYNISVSYIYNTIETIKNSTIFDNTQVHLSSFSFTNGNSQSIRGYLNNTFMIQFTDSSCTIPANSLTISSAIISGSLNSNLVYNPNIPLQLMLPSCSLTPSSSASFRIRVSLTNAPSVYSEQTLILQTIQETFEAYIVTNNQDHPENSDLVLQGDIVYYDKCTSRAIGQVTYTWLCDDTTDPVNIIPCNNDLGLFGIARTSNQITVSNTHFKKGDKLLVTLLVEKNGVVQNSKLPISVGSSNLLIAKISCTTMDCLKYAPNKEFLFTATVSVASGSNAIPRELTSAELAKLTFTWSVSPNVPFAYFEETLKLFSSTLQIPNNIDFLTIELIVKNATRNATAYLTLPINRPPALGTFTAVPLSGTSLSTLFTLQADGWQDDDIPLTYQFFYSFPSDENAVTLLADYSPSNKVISILPGQRPTGPVNLQVHVRDYFGAETIVTTQVQVTPQTLSLQNTLDSYNQLLTEAEQNGPFETAQAIAMITKELNDLEEKLTQNTPDPVCPSCSGRGTCPSNQARCVCQSGWAAIDCSQSQSDVDAIVDLKQTLLQDLVNSYNDMKQNNTFSQGDLNTVQDIIYQVLQETVQNQHFNTNTTLTLVQDILENTLGVTDPNTILTSDQTKALSEILSDMLSFSATYDCSKSTQFTKDLIEKTQLYLEKIAQSSLSDKITNENATIIDTDNIDMYFQTLSICSVNNLVVSAGKSSPQVTININTGLTANCSSEVDLGYYAFNDNLLNCSKEVSSDNNKTIIGINLTDPNTGKTPSNVSVIIDYGGDKTKCPSSCKTLKDGRCYCTDLSPFDVKDQITKVFGDSNLDYLENIQSLIHYKFWTTAAFWLLFTFTLWFLITMYFLRTRFANYSQLSIFKKLVNKSKFTILRTAILVTHPLTSIYCVPRREELSKTTRALLYYARNLLALVFASLFSGPARSDTSKTYDTLSISFSFNIYLVLLPFVTIIPVEFMIEWLLKVEIKRKKAAIKEQKNFKHFLGIFRINVGYLVAGATILGSLLAIMIVSANMTPFQRLAWTINFIQLILQDNLLNYIGYLALQYLGIRMYHHYSYKPKLQKRIHSFLDEQLFAIMELTTTNKGVKIQLKSKSIHAIHPDSDSPSKSLKEEKNEATIDESDAHLFSMDKYKMDSSSQISISNKLTKLLQSNTLMIKEENIEESPYIFKSSDVTGTPPYKSQVQSQGSMLVLSPVGSDAGLLKSQKAFAIDFGDVIQKEEEDKTPSKIQSKTPVGSDDENFARRVPQRLSFNRDLFQKNFKKDSADSNENSIISIDSNLPPSPFKNKRMSFLSLLNKERESSSLSLSQMKTDRSNNEKPFFHQESGNFSDHAEKINDLKGGVLSGENGSLDSQAANRLRDLRKTRQRSAIQDHSRKSSIFKNVKEQSGSDENNNVQSLNNSYVEIELQPDENEPRKIEKEEESPQNYNENKEALQRALNQNKKKQIYLEEDKVFT